MTWGALNMRSDWFFLVLITFWNFDRLQTKTNKKPCCIRGSRNRTYNAVVKFDSYQNWQRHRTVLPAIARLSCCQARYCDCISFVRLSVTLVDQDHIGWKFWKLIAPIISPTPSFFVGHPPTHRETWGNLGETRDGVGKKWRAGAQKRQYLWNAYR